MVSPHLLHVVESFSSSNVPYRSEMLARAYVDVLSWWGRPVYVIPTDKKEPKWCHMILADGPPLKDGRGSELVIIWWSEMNPDTDRVLSVVDWEKHAKDYK